VAVVSFPVIAIGGIRPEHVRSLVHRGAHGVAAIRGIWNDENSELAASRYLSQV
jgi:thiamine monophosphate synthase